MDTYGNRSIAHCDVTEPEYVIVLGAFSRGVDSHIIWPLILWFSMEVSMYHKLSIRICDQSHDSPLDFERALNANFRTAENSSGY